MIVRDGLTEFRLQFHHTNPEKAQVSLIRFHGRQVKAVTTVNIEKRWRWHRSDDFTTWIFQTAGVAACSFDDNFVKDVGRKLALKRAMRHWPRVARTKMWKAYLGRKVVDAECPCGKILAKGGEGLCEECFNQEASK